MTKTRKHVSHVAFTMAEILLSLTIIGVVAAITLPSLTGNINERTWNTQRKALYARMSQAISLMPALNGYGTLEGTFNEDRTQTITEDTAAETFITVGLSKVLKINNICDDEHLEDCGIPDKVHPFSGDALSPVPTTLLAYNSIFNYVHPTNSSLKYAQIDTKVVAFETANGESILTYYNPYCRGREVVRSGFAQPYMCVNFVYDLNGKKGPNTMGKDIGFMTVFNNTSSVVVAPEPLPKDLSGTYYYTKASTQCKAIENGSRMPNHYELLSIMFNQALVPLGASVGSSYYYVSSSLSDTGERFHIATNGYVYPWDASGYVRCVKR